MPTSAEDAYKAGAQRLLEYVLAYGSEWSEGVSLVVGGVTRQALWEMDLFFPWLQWSSGRSPGRSVEAYRGVLVITALPNPVVPGVLRPGGLILRTGYSEEWVARLGGARSVWRVLRILQEVYNEL